MVQDFSEKRDFIRMAMACDMQIRHRDSGQVETAHLDDLSATGVRFHASSALQEGSLMDISICPEKGLTRSMEAEIKVLRCTPMGDQFEIAATIERIHQ